VTIGIFFEKVYRWLTGTSGQPIHEFGELDVNSMS
jgi:hypothetical protein